MKKEVDKSKIKEKFEREHPNFSKRPSYTRNKEVEITEEMINKIIELYPTHSNLEIANAIKMSETQFNYTAFVLRKKGVPLIKTRKRNSLESKIEDVLSRMKVKK